jgi:hypothetical protein
MSHSQSSPRATRNPALQEKYDAALDFLAGKAEEDGENSFQDRMVKTPLKAVHLDNVLKGVDRVVKETPKLSLAMATRHLRKLRKRLEKLMGKSAQKAGPPWPDLPRRQWELLWQGEIVWKKYGAHIWDAGHIRR